MLEPSIDRLLNIVNSKYELVHISSRRSKEMFNTDHYQMSEKKYKAAKDLGRALEEIDAGLISIVRSSDD